MSRQGKLAAAYWMLLISALVAACSPRVEISPKEVVEARSDPLLAAVLLAKSEGVFSVGAGTVRYGSQGKLYDIYLARLAERGEGERAFREWLGLMVSYGRDSGGCLGGIRACETHSHSYFTPPPEGVPYRAPDIALALTEFREMPDGPFRDKGLGWAAGALGDIGDAEAALEVVDEMAGWPVCREGQQECYHPTVTMKTDARIQVAGNFVGAGRLDEAWREFQRVGEDLPPEGARERLERHRSELFMEELAVHGHWEWGVDFASGQGVDETRLLATLAAGLVEAGSMASAATVYAAMEDSVERGSTALAIASGYVNAGQDPGIWATEAMILLSPMGREAWNEYPLVGQALGEFARAALREGRLELLEGLVMGSGATRAASALGAPMLDWHGARHDFVAVADLGRLFIPGSKDLHVAHRVEQAAAWLAYLRMPCQATKLAVGIQNGLARGGALRKIGDEPECPEDDLGPEQMPKQPVGLCKQGNHGMAWSPALDAPVDDLKAKGELDRALEVVDTVLSESVHCWELRELIEWAAKNGYPDWALATARERMPEEYLGQIVSDAALTQLALGDLDGAIETSRHFTFHHGWYRMPDIGVALALAGRREEGLAFIAEGWERMANRPNVRRSKRRDDTASHYAAQAYMRIGEWGLAAEMFGKMEAVNLRVGWLLAANELLPDEAGGLPPDLQRVIDEVLAEIRSR